MLRQYSGHRLKNIYLFSIAFQLITYLIKFYAGPILKELNIQKNYGREIMFLRRSLIGGPIRLKLNLFHNEKILCRFDFVSLPFRRNAAKCRW